MSDSHHSKNIYLSAVIIHLEPISIMTESKDYKLHGNARFPFDRPINGDSS